MQNGWSNSCENSLVKQQVRARALGKHTLQRHARHSLVIEMKPLLCDCGAFGSSLGRGITAGALALAVRVVTAVFICSRRWPS